MAEYFSKNNIEVNVLSGFPYYPAWEISADYKKKKSFYKETINGVNVYRYKQFVPKSPSFIKRILHLLDFTIGTFINLFKIKKTDVVLCVVPFIGAVFVGKILAKLKGAALWVHIQDFEFDAVSDANIVKSESENNFLFKLLFWIEKQLLNSSEIVTTISSAMILKLKSKTTSNTKLLPNWVDISFINPLNLSIHPYLKSTNFKILYSGNIGEKQDWAFFLKFTKALEINSNIEIVVVGSGSKSSWLQNQLDHCKNAIFYTPVAYAELSNLLCSADMHILFQKGDVIDTVMPSKILAMMASKKPSLISGSLQSEVATIIDNSNGGKYIDANNLTDAVKFVNLLIKNRNLIDDYGDNARNYVQKHFSKDEILADFKDTFTSLV